MTEPTRRQLRNRRIREHHNRRAERADQSTRTPGGYTGPHVTHSSRRRRMTDDEYRNAFGTEPPWSS